MKKSVLFSIQNSWETLMTMHTVEIYWCWKLRITKKFTKTNTRIMYT